MGKLHTITIDSIMGGQGQYAGYLEDSQFNASIGIDPDLPILTSGRTKPSGMLVPSAYTKFSGSNLTGYPRWIVTNPKDTNTYVICADGKFISYDNGQSNETVLNAQVTVSIASPGVFTSASHGFKADTSYPIRFVTSGALPTGVVAGTTYYLRADASLTEVNEFWIYDTAAHATAGGATGRVDTSGTQSGTHRIVLGADNADGWISGEGMAYYNNYIYVATPNDIFRYGPLDGTPAINHSFWRGTLNLTALDSTVLYPSKFSVKLPSHAMHVHVDGKLYIGDFDASSSTDTNRGKGLIHRLSTKYGTSGTAHQGAVDDVSAYNVIDLPYDYMPMDIESYGNDIVMLGSQNTDNTIIQGHAALFLWDVGSNSDSFYNQVSMVDPVATALLNHNGILVVWSGNMSSGVRVSEYSGGQSFNQLAFFEDGFAPSAGAIDSVGNRIVWGAFTAYPETAASVMAMGYKHALQATAINNIIRTTATTSASAGTVSALKSCQHASFITPRLIVGWRGASNTYGIDKLGSTYGVAVFRSKMFNFGSNIQIKKISIPLGAAVDANMTITPTIYVDDEITAYAQDAINNTNCSGKTMINIYPNDLFAENNFLLELRWTGTAFLPVKLPITITVEEFEEVGSA